MGLSGGGGGGGALGDAVNGEGEGEGSGKNKGGLIYNPRRRVVTKGALSERDEYYVSFLFLCCRFSLEKGGDDMFWFYMLMSAGRDTETDGQGPGRLGAEAGGEVEGRAGWEIVTLRLLSERCFFTLNSHRTNSSLLDVAPSVTDWKLKVHQLGLTFFTRIT